MRRSGPAAGLGLVGGGLVAYCAPALASGLPRLRPLFGLRDAVAADGVALTFDDGPSARSTPAILRALAALGIQATFFLVGEQVEKEGGLVGEILAAGHEIGIHGYRHGLQLLYTPLQVADDLSRAADAIAGATGFVPARYRPPLGVPNLSHVALARGRGWETWLWTADGRDWMAGATPLSIRRRILGQARPGGVLLLHDADRYGTAGSWQKVTAALPAIVDGIRNRGLNIRPLSAP